MMKSYWPFKMNLLSLLALTAGAAISIQATMNSQLGVLLNSSLIGTFIAFSFSCIFTLLAVILSTKVYPGLSEIQSVPVYLWFSGGALSALGVSLFYYLIPRMGAGSMMSYALTGQIFIAITASHFGWFDLPVKQMDMFKTTGVMALIIGIVLINWT